MSRVRKTTKYEECRSKIIDKIMKEYEKGILKSSRGGLIKDRKQAIAVALSIAGKSCKGKYDKVDIERMVGRIDKVLKSDRPLVRSNLNEFIIIYDWYEGKGAKLRDLIMRIQWKMLNVRMDCLVKKKFLEVLNDWFI